MGPAGPYNPDLGPSIDELGGNAGLTQMLGGVPELAIPVIGHLLVGGDRFSAVLC